MKSVLEQASMECKTEAPGDLIDERNKIVEEQGRELNGDGFSGNDKVICEYEEEEDDEDNDITDITLSQHNRKLTEIARTDGLSFGLDDMELEISSVFNSSPTGSKRGLVSNYNAEVVKTLEDKRNTLPSTLFLEFDKNIEPLKLSSVSDCRLDSKLKHPKMKTNLSDRLISAASRSVEAVSSTAASIVTYSSEISRDINYDSILSQLDLQRLYSTDMEQDMENLKTKRYESLSKCPTAVEITIPARACSKIPYFVPAGKELSWRFLVKDFDIGFSVQLREMVYVLEGDGGSVETEVIPRCTLTSFAIACEKCCAEMVPRHFVFVLDNSYSKLRSKTLVYDLVLSEECEDLVQMQTKVEESQYPTDEEHSWVLYYDDDGNPYYYNHVSDVSQWEEPPLYIDVSTGQWHTSTGGIEDNDLGLFDKQADNFQESDSSLPVDLVPLSSIQKSTKLSKETFEFGPDSVGFT